MTPQPLALLLLLLLAVTAAGDAGVLTAASPVPITSFHSAFGEAFAVILATEVGDRTFFIAAIMAMRHSRLTTWSGAVGALVVMTVLSTLVGYAAPMLIPGSRVYTHYAAAVLFLVFGVRMLREGLHAQSGGASDELEEVELELAKKQDLEAGADESSSEPHMRQVLLQAFTLTFLAEWGDRSQIATIALAAAKEPFGVIVGACIGHALCTGLAVIGGKLLASRISERTVLLLGGGLFVIFAVLSVLQGPGT